MKLARDATIPMVCECITAFFVLLVHCPLAAADAAFSFQQLRSFGFESLLGMSPTAPLIEGSDGYFYGATGGGPDQSGTVFKIEKNGGGYQVLHRFGSNEKDGFAPSGLIEGSDGALYGVTSRGGSNEFSWYVLYGGTVFKINKDGSGYRILHNFGSFGDGQNPLGRLVEASDGALYGTTTEAGTNSGGTLFKLNKDGTAYTNLHHFSFLARPGGGVIEGSNGGLYGTAERDGDHAAGTVFRINKDGSGYSVLHHFSGSYRFTGDDGAFPRASLLQASDGVFYGTTSIGGATNSGTVFTIKPDGTGYRMLHSFDIYSADGSYPDCALIEGTNGFLYGTTPNGGPGGMGHVFMLSKEGTGFTILHRFTYDDFDGLYPSGELMQSRAGVLYGTTAMGGFGGAGIIFRLNGDGSDYEILRSFIFAGGDGAEPMSAVVEGYDGALYGTTPFGGVGTSQGPSGERGSGTVFKVDKDGSDYAVLHRFGETQNDGKEPNATLLHTKHGALYGTTRSGGTNGVGSIFSIRPDGSAYTSLYSFSLNGSDGNHPQAELIQGSDGELYGVTAAGGSNYAGTVFKINTNSTGYTVLHTFALRDGRPLCKLVEGSDGVLYGTTPEGGSNTFGSVFRLSRSGNGYATIHHFDYDDIDGVRPYAGVIEGSDGRLYGTTTQGGTKNNGTVFRLNKDGSGYEVLRSFGPSFLEDGTMPIGGLLEGPDGVLYGTTTYGGDNTGSPGFGTAFRINKDGTGYAHIIFTTGERGGLNPAATLALGSDGAIYGTTRAGGRLGLGIIFRLLKPLVLEPLSYAGDQGFRFSVRGHPGLRIRIQRSGDMKIWNDWGILTMDGNPVTLSDTDSEIQSQHFYRAVFP